MLPFYFTVCCSIPYFLFYECNILLTVQTILYSVFLYYLHQLSPMVPYLLVFVPCGLFAFGKSVEHVSAQMCAEYFPSLVPPADLQISRAETPGIPSMAPPPVVDPVAGPEDERSLA